jgi:hypothetical protein
MSAPTKHYSLEGYLLFGEKRFYPIQLSPAAPKPSSRAIIDKFLRQLNALHFDHNIPDSLISTTKKILAGDKVIPLGSIDIIDYYLKCEILQPGSLNPSVQDNLEERAHVPEPLKKLAFTNIEGVQSSNLVLPLGRLYASHHHRVKQSH